MARVKRGVTSHKRHKRLLNAAEGRTGTNRKLIKRAHEAQLHALAYATRDRKQRKRDMRELWIIRINAAARANGSMNCGAPPLPPPAPPMLCTLCVASKTTG